MEDQPSRSIKLTQKELFDRLLTVLNLVLESDRKNCRAEYGASPTMQNGDECSEMWNYTSLVGMLMHLSLDAYPGITFAVNQCARFIH